MPHEHGHSHSHSQHSDEIEEDHNHEEHENNGDTNHHEPLIQKKKDKHKPEEKESSAKAVAFVSIGMLTMLYCIAELGAALYLGSLTLLSDGFHNLSDVVSLYIAYWAQKAAKRDLSDEMSYGWARTEILGGLTNGCFLLSLSLYVALEAVPKLIWPEPMIDGGFIFIFIAAAGLVINTVGTIVFAAVGLSHSHSHGHSHGHGHAHGGHKGEKKAKELKVNIQGEVAKHSPSKEKKHKKKEKKKMDLNVGAVFIHYLGDAISSLFVLIAGLVIRYIPGKWSLYVDPISSLLIVGIILGTTIPLVKKCSMILLQSVPTDLDVDDLRTKLRDLDGVISVHDLHVWQLVDGVVIASVHLACQEAGVDFGTIVYQVKKIFHSYGIHSTAIQPEFVAEKHAENFCKQNCVEECEEIWCCKKTADSHGAVATEYNTMQSI